MADTVNVAQVIDGSSVKPIQYRVFALCLAVVFADGFDVQAISYIAPMISRDWGLGRGALGPVFSAGLFGLMIGSLLVAPLADRFGRRAIIIGSTLVFALLSLATALSDSMTTLLVFRFLTGLGLGGALPNAIALTSEYSPRRRRGLAVMVVVSGMSLGSITAGLLAAKVAAIWGWQSVFIIGGVLPLLALPAICLGLPESIQFSALSKTGAGRAAALLARIDPGLRIGPQTVLATDEAEASRMSVGALFRLGRTRSTLVLWVAYFATMVSLYLIVNWLPTMLTSTGFDIPTAALIATLFHVGGLVGTYGFGATIDRIGAPKILVAAYLIAAVGVLVFGASRGLAMTPTVLILALVGFGIIGAQVGLGALASLVYPTAIRSTGVGWALGIGRAGSILGPAVGGVLLGLHMHPGAVFMLCAGPIAVAAIAVGSLLLGGPPRPAPEPSPA